MSAQTTHTLNTPFKFLDAYQKEDIHIFFGREEETEALYEALAGVKHLLVYGPSGSGKTSLVECGLRNQFSDADWFALTIRKKEDISASLFRTVNAALPPEAQIALQDNGLPKDDTLRFEHAVERLFEEKYQPVYLLFDQFEELFISGTSEEQKRFFTYLNTLIHYKVPCRILLILREEFIGYFSEYETRCPSIFQYRFRVEKMAKKAVRKVIKNTLEAETCKAHFQVEDSEQLTETLLRLLPDQRREIELTHVQVFLHELWMRAHEEKKADALPVLHTGLIREDDQLSQILENFLQRQREELEEKYKSLPIEVLGTLISSQGTKLPRTLAQINSALAADEIFETPTTLYGLLEDLQQRRILRAVTQEEVTYYEISHDLLALATQHQRTDLMRERAEVKKIYANYEEQPGLLSEEQLQHVMLYVERFPFRPELRKKVRKSEEKVKAEKPYVGLGKQVGSLLKHILYLLPFFVKIGEILFDSIFYMFYIALLRVLPILSGISHFSPLKKILEKIGRTLGFVVSLMFTVTLLSLPVMLFAALTSLAATIRDLHSHLEGSKTPTNIFKGTWLYKTSNLIKNGSLLQRAFNHEELKLNRRLKPKEIEKLNVRSVLNEREFASQTLSAIPARIRRYTSLKNIDLRSHPNIDWRSLKYLPNATTLTLSTRSLHEIPEEYWVRIIGLEYIEQETSSFPQELLALQGQLQSLALDGAEERENNFTTFPSALTRFTKLRTLSLQHARLKSVAEGLGGLQLERLDLSFNMLQSMRPLCTCTTLRRLSLQNNAIKEVPAEIAGMKALEELDLAGNNLYSSPEALIGLESLKVLNLSENGLEVLPKSIGKLSQLEALDISRNQFAQLPTEMEHLKELRVLKLAHNRFCVKPSFIANLEKLEYLVLNYEDYTLLLDDGIAFPKRLTKITLFNVPIQLLTKKKKRCKDTVLPEGCETQYISEAYKSNILVATYVSNKRKPKQFAKLHVEEAKAHSFYSKYI